MKARALKDRFLEKIWVNLETGCWEWTAYISREGYGAIWAADQVRKAHRVSYELHIGLIPAGLELDHLCRVRHCVNPEHLEPVTGLENIRRSRVGAFNASKAHCSRGHEYNEVNTYYAPNGERSCRACKDDEQRCRRARRKGQGFPTSTPIPSWKAAVAAGEVRM